DPVPGGAADHLRRHAARPHLRADQYRGRRVPDQFRRAGAAHQRACGALRSRRHLCGDPFRDPDQHQRVRPHRMAGAMAETGRMPLPAAAPRRLQSVTALRIAIIVVTLACWEALAASGLLYRDVVPSLLAIGKALFNLLTVPDMAVDLSRFGLQEAKI